MFLIATISNELQRNILRQWFFENFTLISFFKSVSSDDHVNVFLNYIFEGANKNHTQFVHKSDDQYILQMGKRDQKFRSSLIEMRGIVYFRPRMINTIGCNACIQLFLLHGCPACIIKNWRGTSFSHILTKKPLLLLQECRTKLRQKVDSYFFDHAYFERWDFFDEIKNKERKKYCKKGAPLKFSLLNKVALETRKLDSKKSDWISP